MNVTVSTFKEALERYDSWAETQQDASISTQPNEHLSHLEETGWHLEDTNGLLAVVTAEGEVIPFDRETRPGPEDQLTLEECDREEGRRFYNVVQESRNLLVGKAYAEERGGKLVLTGLSTDAIIGLGGGYFTFRDALEEAKADVQILEVLAQLEDEGKVQFEDIHAKASIISYDVFPDQTYEPVDCESKLRSLVEAKFKEHKARLSKEDER